MVNPAPLRVTPSGIVSGTVVSQSAVSVKVEPLGVPGHAVSMLGSMAAATPPGRTTGRAVAETRMAAKMSPLRSRDTMTSRAIPTTSDASIAIPSCGDVTNKGQIEVAQLPATWQAPTSPQPLSPAQRRGR